MIMAIPRIMVVKPAKRLFKNANNAPIKLPKPLITYNINPGIKKSSNGEFFRISRGNPIRSQLGSITNPTPTTTAPIPTNSNRVPVL